MGMASPDDSCDSFIVRNQRTESRAVQLDSHSYGLDNYQHGSCLDCNQEQEDQTPCEVYDRNNDWGRSRWPVRPRARTIH